MAIEAAVAGGLSPRPEKLFDGDDGKSYTAADILAFIRKRDEATDSG